MEAFFLSLLLSGCIWTGIDSFLKNNPVSWTFAGSKVPKNLARTMRRPSVRAGSRTHPGAMMKQDFGLG